jgi:oligoribonuclease NrnB/cAMP/cGMP phosphodiesterase (DHH superfamily)
MDGRCSGAIVKMKYPECEMIGINYGDAFPWEKLKKDEVVYMVDFTLQPFEDMERLNGICQLRWIDHHKTAMEEAYKRRFLASSQQLINEEYAGCELTWQLIEETATIPWFVFLLGCYDVWDHHNHPGSLEFQYGIRNLGEMMPEDPQWPELFDTEYVNRIIQDGALLLGYEKRQNTAYAKSCAYEVIFDGLRCIVINKGLANSLLFESVYDPEKHDAMMSFVRRDRKWTVSLYSSKSEIDVSAICKRRGGGGHKGAAGFQCVTLPFIEEVVV